MKIAAPLLALALVLGACASDPDEETSAGDGAAPSSADDSTTSSSAAAAEEEPADEAMEDEAAGGEAGEDEAMNDPAGGDADDDAMEDDPEGGAAAAGGGAPGLLIAAVLGQAGVEPTDEIVACVEGRGVDLDLAPTASEAEVAEATLAIFGCAPEELGQVLAEDTDAPPGTDRDDVACVIGETFRYLSELPTDVALAALEADTPPQEIRDDLGPIAQDACGLDADQVDAIFDS